jgi:hypothetical protein
MASIILNPETGVIGIPEGVKEAGKRVDFKPNDFDFMIETKGYRMAWQRASLCPCQSVTSKTEQPNPNCSLCGGNGWTYFGRGSESLEDDVGTLDDIQAAIVSDMNAYVIRGIMTNLTNMPDANQTVGFWQAGDMKCTVRPENKLGYYDKLVSLDSEIGYSERLTADGSNKLTTRFRATNCNLLRTETRVYEIGTDYNISTTGEVTFLQNTPIAGQTVGIHYLCHPTFLVVDHPHSIRTSLLKYKKASLQSPVGDPLRLPIQATVRLDFVPEPTNP